MDYDRYSLVLNRGVNAINIFALNINVDDFEDIEIEGQTYTFHTGTYNHEFDNATYDYLVTFYTKPVHIHTIGNQFRMYRTSIGFVKTKDGQVLYDVQNRDSLGTLDRHKGLLSFLDVHFVVYDDTIRIAVESVFHSITQTVLSSTMKHIFDNHYINNQVINVFQDCNVVKDYSPSDFEATFNTSNRDKKAVFLLDGVDDTEFVNSGRMEFSLSHDLTFENAMTWLRSKINGNVRRYSIKCHDHNDNRTASLNGYPGVDARLDEWMQPARLIDVDHDSPTAVTTLAHFLRF